MNQQHYSYSCFFYMKHKNKKIGKFNLIEENICDLDCDCGWNLTISGEDKADLDTIKNYLEYGEDKEKFDKIDRTKLN